MIRHDYRVAGEKVTINVLEHLEDLEPLRAWFAANGRNIIACDTEGTGLNPYAVDFELRHVQFGDATTGWVLPYSRFTRPIAGILNHPGYRFVFHNAPYDVAVFDALGIVDGNELAARTEDTKIRAHLVDPRPQQDGGVGLGLKQNTAHHVDPGAPDTQSGLHKVFSALVRDNTGDVHDVSALDTKERAKLRKGLREQGLSPRTLKVDEGWRHIPLFHPIYTLYAGLDVIYTYRLHTTLSAKVRQMGMAKLADFEHQVLRACLREQLKGLLIDAPYLEELGQKFREEANAQEAEALKYGVDKVGAPAQLVAAFLEMGEKLRAKTPTGNYKVDKGVLYRLADLNQENDEPLNSRTPNPLAVAVLKAKRAEKWRASYVDKTLALLDKNGRVHPSIRSLQARTARMSISDPPYQQLPSSDYLVRSGVIGSPGNVILSTDYDQIEMRVAAAFAGEESMILAAREGRSQHELTARHLYGDAFNKKTMPQEYKIAKMVGFGSVYGGGAPTLSTQTGLPLEKSQEIVKMFREAYPALTAWKREIGAQVLEDALTASELTKHRKCIKLMFEAETDQDRTFWRREASAICRGKYATITTPIGRVLPVEAEFSYKVSNYYVQSTARDVLASALCRLVDSSLSSGLLLPIHDEVLAEAPEAEAEEYIREMGRIMTTEFRGVPLSAEGKIHGRSWGDGYKR
jgi:DNA polymerase I - 3''-5'' exonuclease and polymerase domains